MKFREEIRHLTRAMAAAATALFIISTAPSAAQGPEVSMEKDLVKAEITLFGTTGEGGLILRLGKVEETLLGHTGNGSILERGRKISSALFEGGNGSVPLTVLCNFMEWRLTEKVGHEPLLKRILSIENLVFGKPMKGPLTERVGSILAKSVLGKRLTVHRVVVPEGALIKIRLIDPISSRTAQPGDRVRYEISDNILIGESLALPRGVRGECNVCRVRKASKFGRNGSIVLDFMSVSAIDGSQVYLEVNSKAIENNQQAGIAAGASLVGLAALGPVGLLGGGFVQGKDVEIQSGTEMYASVREPLEVTAVYLPDAM